jgi:hypothetical protein
LVQIDGSEHRWFKDRGLPCSLLVFIDDATGKLMLLRFVVGNCVYLFRGAGALSEGAHGASAFGFHMKDGRSTCERPVSCHYL